MIKLYFIIRIIHYNINIRAHPYMNNIHLTLISDYMDF